MILRRLIPYIIFTPVLLIQLYVIPIIEISGIVPDLILILIIFYTIKEGQIFAMILAMIFGFIYDLSTGSLIGSSMLSGVVTAFIIGYFYSENKTDAYLSNPIFPLIVFFGGFLNSGLYNLIVNFDINISIGSIVLFSAFFPALYSAFVSSVISMMFDTIGAKNRNG